MLVLVIGVRVLQGRSGRGWGSGNRNEHVGT